MARPIWTGTISFGLLHVPVSLMSGERRIDLQFRLLDSRDQARVRYERVNADTGEEVPWKEIVKAFEYDKGSYVVLDPEDLKAAASEGRETVEIESFAEAAQIDPRYYEKPYVLVPGKKAEKGYVLLRETLAATGLVGIAKVVIRTREYLSVVMPHGDALALLLLRYPQELVELDEFKLPSGSPAEFRISDKELSMARELIESMAGPWTPADYKDEFRDRLQAVIAQRMKNQGLSHSPSDDDDSVMPADAATNVVDFMSLLRKSISDNKRTPAKKSKSTSASKEKTPAKSAKATKSSTRAASKKTAAAKKAPAKRAGKAAAAKKKPAAKKSSVTRKAG